MTEYKYHDIIEYEDATWSDEFEEARQWAKENNAELVELIDKRETRTITEEYEEEDLKTGKILKKIRKVEKLFRYFEIK